MRLDFLPCRQPARAVNLNGCLEEDRPDEPVGPEEREPVPGLGLGHELHVVAGRGEPLEQEDGESRSLDGHQGDQHPGQRVEGLWNENQEGRSGPEINT